MPEHLPYVHAGFAVVAYDLDGELPEDPHNRPDTRSSKGFQEILSRNAAEGIPRGIDWLNNLPR